MSHGPKRTKELPSAQRLAELFWYDANSGDLIRRIDAGRNGREKAGTTVGTKNGVGYLVVTADGVQLLAHRVAFAIAYGNWPEGQIDHIDGNRMNNRLLNLRDVSVGENNQNRKPCGTAKSGFPGVSKYRNRWTARLKLKGKNLHLGCFDTPQEAHETYLKTKRLLHPCSTL